MQNVHLYRDFLLSAAGHAAQRLDLVILSTTWPLGYRRRRMPIPSLKYSRFHLLGGWNAPHATGVGDAANNGIAASGDICSTSRRTCSSTS